MTLLSVGLGAVLAWQQITAQSWTITGLIAFAAVAGHMAVNLLNEYQDFQSGLDAITTRTPFSGGSGALPEHPEAAATVATLAALCLAVSMTIGGYLVWLKGWPLAALGALGIVLILTYTRWLTRSPWLCLLAPGIGFGIVIIWGTVIALGGQLTGATLALSVITTLLVSELLLVNQLPDADADRQVGRNHWVIHYGKASAVAVIRGLLGLAYLILVAALASGLLSTAYALVLPTLPLALWVGTRASNAGMAGQTRIRLLRANTALVLITLFLLVLATLL
ncbi:MAG: prenyltransferase [Marinobacter sp.]|nr:prenyltransferase [Marinobacter sp.]